MDSREYDSIEGKLRSMKSKYYSENRTNRLFKNSQKLACAKDITMQLDIEPLLNKTINIAENTNQIHADYTIFKLFANPSVYAAIIDHIDKLIVVCVKEHNSFELHINMNTFTITAAHRHSQLIRALCETTLQKGSLSQTNLHHIYLYNYPSIIQNIIKLFSGFVDDSTREKVILVKQP